MGLWVSKTIKKHQYGLVLRLINWAETNPVEVLAVWSSVSTWYGNERIIVASDSRDRWSIVRSLCRIWQVFCCNAYGNLVLYFKTPSNMASKNRSKMVFPIHFNWRLSTAESHIELLQWKWKSLKPAQIARLRDSHSMFRLQLKHWENGCIWFPKSRYLER